MVYPMDRDLITFLLIIISASALGVIVLAWGVRDSRRTLDRMPLADFWNGEEHPDVHDCMTCRGRPGSESAVALGCTCPVKDNGYGHNLDYPVVNLDCPLHRRAR